MNAHKVTVTVLAAAMVVFSITPPVMATVYFNDGGIHDIAYEILDSVRVDMEAPGMHTTVNLLPGGSIAGGLWTYGTSVVTVSGGSISWLYAHDSSQVTVSGSPIGRVYAYDSSQVTFSGGSTVNDLRAYGTSQLTVSGGSTGGELGAYDNSQVTVSGGLIGWHLYARNSSVVTVSGGSIWEDLRALESSQVTVSGGSIGDDIIAGWGSGHESVITFLGTDFAVDGEPFGYGELTSILGGGWDEETARRLTGTLASGDLLDNDFYIGGASRIVLAPEPATIGLMALGIGGLLLKRTRRLGTMAGKSRK